MYKIYPVYYNILLTYFSYYINEKHFYFLFQFIINLYKLEKL